MLKFFKTIGDEITVGINPAEILSVKIEQETILITYKNGGYTNFTNIEPDIVLAWLCPELDTTALLIPGEFTNA